MDGIYVVFWKVGLVGLMTINAMVKVVVIMAGLYGMSYYSTSDWADDNEMTNSNHLHRNDSGDEADDDNEQEILLDGENSSEFENEALHPLANSLEIDESSYRDLASPGREKQTRSGGTNCHIWKNIPKTEFRITFGTNVRHMGWELLSTNAFFERRYWWTGIRHQLWHWCLDCYHYDLDIKILIHGCQIKFNQRRVCDITIISYKSHVAAWSNCRNALVAR